ncbi:ATP-grasp domain-containing protein [Acidipila sp. EB88]|uniref:ATP-grasp domain-containing protein n=1 Tax=Acidipila sp. EB88 TaxID=2305226 RepID=UPI0013155E73|nr:ATP-grasp domain-containing protein [Acidipila sp. EB88]
MYAVCPAGSQMAYSQALRATYRFRTLNPLASLRAAILRCKPDYIMPADDRAVWFLHELSTSHPEFAPLIERSLGPASSYAVVRSRTLALALAAKLGVAVPGTLRIRTAEDLESCADSMPHPFFIKKDGTWGGGGVHVANDRESAREGYTKLLAEQSLGDKLRQLLKQRDHTAFARLRCVGPAEISAQAHIEGVAANAMFACHEGKLLGSVQAKVIAAKGKTGAALMIELIEDERMHQAGVLLAGALKLSGFFGLDFIIEEGTGVPYLIEVNPRCTQLGHVAMASKLDLAGMLWKQWTGLDNAVPGGRELGTAVAFYPQAVEWDAESAFLRHSRFDVCSNDLATVTELSTGDPSLRALLRRRALQLFRYLRPRDTQAPSAKIFYFAQDAALGPRALRVDALAIEVVNLRQMDEQEAAGRNYHGPAGGQRGVVSHA